MSIITLLSDFGTDDAYVGIMKGVILKVNPAVTIVDITHAIAPQDLVQAAFTVDDYYKYFPEKTVHIIVVDPGVGSDRAIVAMETEKHIFLAPDNGVLTRLMDGAVVGRVVRVNNKRHFQEPVSKTFHGRDIFAPVGAHLSKTLRLNDVGEPIDPGVLVRLSLPRPYLTEEGTVAGAIVSIDRFGNLITNIDWRYLKERFATATMPSLKILIGNRIVKGLSPSYDSSTPNEPLAIIGSRGYVEISVNLGSACAYFGSDKGDRVEIIKP